MDKAEFDRRAQKIATECNSIQPMYIAFYIEAIYYASDRGAAAFHRFNESVKRGASNFEIVANLHEALGHAAALSRFFFPVEKKALPRARAAQLKQIFAVSNSSVLEYRDLRNALEHFDERLDEYLLNDIAGYIFPSPMVDDADISEEKLGHIFRLVDFKKQIFVLFGQKYSFKCVQMEVENIAKLAQSKRQ